MTNGDFCYTYVLRLGNSDLYIGSTTNLTKRVAEHDSGHVSSTRHKRPVELVYFEACLSIEAARSRERQLKTGYGRAYLKRRITDAQTGST